VVDAEPWETGALTLKAGVTNQFSVPSSQLF